MVRARAISMQYTHVPAPEVLEASHEIFHLLLGAFGPYKGAEPPNTPLYVIVACGAGGYVYPAER